MGYALRSALPDGYFHVWIRGVCSIPPFPEPDDRTAALGMLLKAGKRFRVKVLAATILTTHYHAIVEAEVERLSAAMQWFHSRYARAFNRRYGRYGHVFAERFQCKAVEEYGVHDRCGYVLGNPVAAGLCDAVDQWPWSYYRYRIERF